MSINPSELFKALARKGREKVAADRQTAARAATERDNWLALRDQTAAPVREFIDLFQDSGVFRPKNLGLGLFHNPSLSYISVDITDTLTFKYDCSAPTYDRKSSQAYKSGEAGTAEAMIRVIMDWAMEHDPAACAELDQPKQENTKSRWGFSLG